jgi:hypothetical protein
MPCGYDPETCLSEHQSGKPLYLRVTKTARAKDGLPGRPVQWSHGTCPLCSRADKLSASIKGKSIEYCCHVCKASPKALRDAVALLLPGHVGPTRPPKAATFTRGDFEDLLGLSDAAIRLRVACIAWQMTPKQAADKLGMSRRTYYRAVTAVPDMARSRRSP